MSAVIVHGPQACGKTRNAAALKRHFKCKRIVDDWYGQVQLQDGDLALTFELPAYIPRGARIIDFDAAMKAIRKGARK